MKAPELIVKILLNIIMISLACFLNELTYWVLVSSWLGFCFIHEEYQHRRINN